MNRDDIRKAILNSRLDSELVSIPEWGDVKVEVRSRTVDEMYSLLAKARKTDGELDDRLLAVETIIACTFVPDTDERIFDDADRDTLRTKDSRGFQRLLAAANKAAGLESEDEVVSALDETPADASSSG